MQSQEKMFSVFVAPYIGQGTGNIKGIESNNARGFQIGLSQKIDPEKTEWAKFFNAERTTISFIYLNMNDMLRFGIPFGESYGLAISSDFRLWKIKNFKLLLTPEMGLTYNTVTVKTNPDSFIFGSHINALVGGIFSAEYQMSDKWSAFSSVSYIHSSNGSTKLPNAGSNVLVYGIGIRKSFKGDVLPQVYQNPEINKNGLEFAVGLGSRGKYKQNGGFTKVGFYGGYSRFINRVFGLRIGFDGVYYEEVYNPEVYEDTVPYWGKSYEHWRLGGSIGAEAKFGNLGINWNFGRYLYFKSPYNQKTYWNANVRYYLSPKFGLQATLNAHKFQADYVNWGLFCRL